jgi:Zn-dependent protease
MLLSLSRYGNNPRALITLALAIALALIIGIAFHEFSHALTAFWLGDTTAQSMGRLTLNPLAHLDPAGTLMMVIIGFGWGKPTPVNPNRLRHGPRLGMALVSIAGPISNFLMAAIFALPLKFNWVELGPSFQAISRWTVGNYLALLFFYVTIINIVLGLFNLLPIAPLDGSKIASGLPGEIGDFFRRIEPYGPPILMVLIALSWFSPSLSIFGRVISPLEGRILNVLVGQ